MTSSRLADARAKAAWAEEHLLKFVQRTFNWAENQEQQALPIGKFYDGNIGAFVYQFIPGPIGPGDWSLILGDLLVNFRAVLDYIAWQIYGLAIEQGMPRVGERTERLVAFPIVTDGNPGAKQSASAYYAATLDDFLPGLDRLDSFYGAIVERRQPFKRGAQARDHPLAALQRMVNIDKHRRLHGTVIRPESFKVLGVAEQTNFRVTRLEPLPVRRADPGTPFLRVHGDVVGNDVPEVKMYFGGGTSTIAVVGETSLGDLIWYIWNYVKDVLAEFDAVMP